MDENQPTTKNPCSPPPDLPPEMMEQILQYLSFKDLLSCRLVWKGHDAIMKEFIGKKMKPILFDVNTAVLRDHLKYNPNSPVPDELQLKLTFEEDHETIKEICENLRGKIKHLKIDMDRNYYAGDWRTDTEYIISARTKYRTSQFQAANARLLVQVLELFGDRLETLEYGIFMSSFCQIANSAGNFNFPSLQKITIFGEPPIVKSGDKNLSIWNQLIFKNCGKLKSIQLQSSKRKEVHVVKDLREVGRLTQITSLGIRHLGMGHNLGTLLKYESVGGLQIEELHIEKSLSIKNEEFGFRKLERVLKMQSKKLKTFSFVCEYFRNFKMPVMEQLTSLKLEAEYYDLRNICFNKITPKIKSLEIHENGGSMAAAVLFDTTAPCKTLETLKINPSNSTYGGGIPLEAGVCDVLAKKFPSVTSLTLSNPGEEFLQKLWTAWPNLLKLDLTLSEEFKDLDQSLFGITPEWKKSVDKNIDQWWTLNEPPPDSQIQSICNIKKLQVLRIYRTVPPKCFRRIQGGPERREIVSNFSEFSFFYGLKNMKRLKVFSINQGSFVSQEEEISVEARDFIRGELPSLRIQSCETSPFSGD